MKMGSGGGGYRQDLLGWKPGPNGSMNGDVHRRTPKSVQKWHRRNCLTREEWGNNVFTVDSTGPLFDPLRSC